MFIHKTARYRVPPEAIVRVRRAIAEFVAYDHTHEPGTPHYVALQDAKDPASFLHASGFRDTDAESRHATSDAMNRFTAVLY